MVDISRVNEAFFCTKIRERKDMSACLRGFGGDYRDATGVERDYSFGIVATMTDGVMFEYLGTSNEFREKPTGEGCHSPYYEEH